MSSTEQLISAIKDKEIVKVSVILKAMDVSEINKQAKGNTALGVACKGGNHESLDKLLSRDGIDVNIKDFKGWRPLHEASKANNVHAVSRLVAMPQIDVNAKLSIHFSLFTPLHVACRNNSYEIVKILLAAPGIGVNSKSRRGLTPAMVSAYNCHVETLEMMLECPSVDLDTKDEDGKGLEDLVGYWGDGRGWEEEKNKCLEIINNERMKRKNGWVEQQPSQDGSIGQRIKKVESLTKEIGDEEDKMKRDVEMSKQKRSDLKIQQTRELAALNRKHKKEEAELETTITTINEVKQRYISLLKEQRDELVQDFQKMRINPDQDVSEDRDKLELALNKQEAAKRALECPVHIDLLDNICESVFAEWSPGKSEIEARAAVTEEVGHYVKQTWPSAYLTPFGSSCNGFIFKSSDLDLSLKFTDYKYSDNLDESCIIKTLAKDLAPVMSNVTAVTGARVPIVMLIHPRTRIEVDISIYNELGGENSRLLRVYASLDERVQKLGYMVKLLAKTCGIGDASQGSLSSYSHILMMIFYLQQVSPPVVPVLQEMFLPGKEKPTRLVGGWDVWFYAPADVQQFRLWWEGFGRNTMTVGELWLGFLNFYATEFNSDQAVVCIRRYEPLWKREKNWRSSSLAIEDPFKINHNLGGISAAMDSFIKKTFSKASKHFRTTLKVKLSGYRDIEHYFFNPELLTEGPPPNQKCRSCGITGHRSDQCPKMSPTETAENDA